MSLVRRGSKGIYHAVLYARGKYVSRSLKTTDYQTAKRLYEKQRRLVGV